MKIERMINTLKDIQRRHPGIDIKIGDRDGESVLFIVEAVNTENGKCNIWLEAESHLDLGAELDARYENKKKYSISDVDFYRDLLELSITSDMVRKYMGDEAADHMEKTCREVWGDNYDCC